MLNIGDEVVVRVAQENREWGYNPAPDDTPGKVVDFDHIAHGRLNGHTKPGVYLNRYWPKVKLSDGRTITIGSFHLKNLTTQSSPTSSKDDDWLSELPESSFWEGDRVSIDREDYKEPNYYVVGVDHLRLKDTINDGSPYPAYRCSSSMRAGWHASFKENELTLLERGNVWKHYHNEPIIFESLEEEANFANQLGLTEHLKNPKSNNYAWELGEVLEFIHQGNADGFSAGHSMFGGGINHTVLKFHDRDLGRRVRDKVLAEFSSRMP